MTVILLRTVLMYGVILLAVRLMGKRQVSQLQNSELVVTLLLSELAVLPIQEEEKSLWVGLAPMAALVACELLVSVLMLKSGRFRQLVCGSPTVVIERGQVLQKAMRRLRLTTEDLFEQLRQKGVFYLEDVAWAIVDKRDAQRHPAAGGGACHPQGAGAVPCQPGAGSGGHQRWRAVPALPGAVRQGPGLGAPPVARAGPGAGAGIPDDGAHRWQVEGDRKKDGHGAGQVKRQRYV